MDQFSQGVTQKIQQAFDPAVLGAQLTEFTINLITAIIVFLAFYLAWKIMQTVIDRLLHRHQLDPTSSSFIRSTLQYTVLAIGTITAIGILGINTATLLASLGVAGFTIGFAAKDAFSNIISGVLIFLDRPFVVGDLVEIDQDYGQVDNITLRSTRIVTPDGKMIAVPNTEIINKKVTSYSNYPHLRLDIPITIGVDENIAKVRRLLLNLIEGKKAYLEKPKPEVFVKAINDYNLALELRVWLKDESKHIPARAKLTEQVFTTLRKAGINMPYETLTVITKPTE